MDGINGALLFQIPVFFIAVGRLSRVAVLVGIAGRRDGTHRPRPDAGVGTLPLGMGDLQTGSPLIWENLA